MDTSTTTVSDFLQISARHGICLGSMWPVASSIPPPPSPTEEPEAMATPDVFGRACPHCQSTTTICMAGTSDLEVWLCHACRRHFEVALDDDQRGQIGGASGTAVERNASPDLANVQCPHCGYGAGLYLAPHEERTAATPVRCLSCGGDSVIEGWQTR